MKPINLLLFAALTTFISCDAPMDAHRDAQKGGTVPVVATTPSTVKLKLVEAAHGNTSRRGMVQRDEKGQEMPHPPGYDFYNTSLSAAADCEVEGIEYCIDGKCLPLTVNNQTGKVKCKKSEGFYTNASANPEQNGIKNCTRKFGSKAILVCKVNGVEQIIEINEMKEILPN